MPSLAQLLMYHIQFDKVMKKSIMIYPYLGTKATRHLPNHPSAE